MQEADINSRIGRTSMGNTKPPTLLYKAFHWLPFDDVDWKKLVTHLLASFLLALAMVFDSHVPLKEIMTAWAGGSLTYIAGFLQKGSKESVVLVDTKPKIEDIRS